MVSEEKERFRRAVWTKMDRPGVARFPKPRGRIPNFVGAEAAAERLLGVGAMKRARTVKVNPDSPQRPLRHRALKAGKVLVVAVPRLREAKCFLKLDPVALGEKWLWEASSIRGASELGLPLAPNELPPIDMIVTGSVAVATDGVRIGKGGGYSDLELALLRAYGKTSARVPIATTVHRLQVHDAGVLPTAPHDQSLDYIVTPDAVIRTAGRRPRPRGVDWALLSTEQIAAMPVLGKLRRRREKVR